MFMYGSAEKKAKKEEYSSFDSQFSVQIDNGYSTAGSFNHENLMQQYIENKIGSTKNAPKTVEKSALAVEEERLYRVPDYIKVTSEQSIVPEVQGDEDLNGIKAAWSTGIAEVALPVSFKLKNIEETEKIVNAKLLHTDVSGGIETGASSSSALSSKISSWTDRPAYYHRFQKMDNNFAAAMNKEFKAQQGDPHFQYDWDASGDAIEMPEGTSSTMAADRAAIVAATSGPPKRSQLSSDDYALQKFKKSQLQMKRR